MEPVTIIAGVGYGWDVWYWISLFILLFVFLVGAPLIMHYLGSEPDPPPSPSDENEA